MKRLVVAALGILLLGVVSWGFNGFDSIWRREAISETITGLKDKFLANPADTQSLEKIINHAKGSYSFGRCYALGALTELAQSDALGNREAEIARLMGECVLSNDGFVRHAAGAGLMRMGKKSQPATRDLIAVIRKYPNDGAAMFAVRTLHEIGEVNPEILDTLRYATTAPDSMARKVALDWLQELEKK